MEKTNAIQNVPRLRFRDFENPWTKVTLQEASVLQRGRFSPRPRNDPRYYGGAIPFVQTNDVVNCGGRIERYSQTLNEDGLAVSKLFPVNTILMTIAANIGFTGVLQIEMACPDSLIGIICKEDFDPYFLNYYLSTQQSNMEYLAPEGAQRNINVEFLKPYPVPKPSLPEQEKIAAFLSAVDRKIQQLTRKKELLEQYKNGVMQQLFAREIRFKRDDGSAFPDWEEKRLGEVLWFKNGANADKEQYGRGYKFINVLDILQNDFITHDRIIGSVELPEAEFKKNEVIYSDILFQRSSETREDVGLSNVYLDKEETAAFGGFVIRGRAKEPFDPQFMNFLLRSDRSRQDITSRSGGSTRYNIGQESLEAVMIALPSLEEQQKIATFLSALDGRVGAVQRQIAGAVRWKKGLLEGMFV